MVNTLFTALALIAAGQAEMASARLAGASEVRSTNAAERGRRALPSRSLRRVASADRPVSPR